ncbi:transcription termination factor 5, mitochondrial [Dermacentor andersoni]|uniref:transcription termination factor 5, mitochondrial n=1 Tax=Dermacentor andersoni TaxID=34620 RepID=UPI002155EC49|nr:transcription termination factor 5, mitochondrial-like [Dermacentor andersoni]
MLLNSLRIGGRLCWKLARGASAAAPSRVTGTSPTGRSSSSKARLASKKRETKSLHKQPYSLLLSLDDRDDDDFNLIEEPEGSPSEQSRARIQLLTESLGCSLASATSIVMSNRKILSIRRETLLKNIGMLKSLFPVREIMRHPEIFSFQFGAAEQRYRNLEECGITKVTPARVIRYVELMTKPAYSLKLQGEVAVGTDPAAHMLSYLDCPARVRADILSELPLHYPFTLSIAEVKQAVLRAYLAWRLGCSREQIALLVRKYPSVENRSLQFLRHTIELLTNHFHMPTDKILRNGFVLLAHPGNLESQLSQVRHLAGLEMRELAVLCPRLLTVPAENLIRVERLLQAHGITPAQVQRCIRIYSLSPETIEKRLKEITKVAEFEVRRECPRLLNLVYYASKARHRLELLSQLGHPASGVSINVLSMAASDFARVFYSGSDRGRPRETAEYLAHLLRKPEAEVRQRLASHPSAKRISLLNTRRVVDWLLPRGVTHEQLWYGLQVVLYDSELVASHFLRLPEQDELQPYSEWRDCPELLEVLLYYIEREARFTGHTQLGLFSKVEASDSTSQEKANQAASLQNPYFHPATLPTVQKEEEQTEEDGSSSS